MKALRVFGYIIIGGLIGIIFLNAVATITQDSLTQVEITRIADVIYYYELTGQVLQLYDKIDKYTPEYIVKHLKFDDVRGQYYFEVKQPHDIVLRIYADRVEEINLNEGVYTEYIKR